MDKTNPHQAVNFNSFVYKNHLIIVGGSVKINKKGKKVFTDKIHLFNLQSGAWHEIGKMPNPRETSGILADDKIFLVGGYKNKPVSFIESWDLTNNEWKLEGDLFTAFKKPAITSHKKNIYIYDYGKLLIYNTLEKSLKEYKIGLHLKEANIHFYKNSLYIIGGYIVKHYGTEPATGVYKIKLTEFAKTKVNRFKKLNKH
nr:kelch repeat-containing protein [Lutibacter sp. Hel_I_33_5]